MNTLGILFAWGTVVVGIQVPPLPDIAVACLLVVLFGLGGMLAGVLDGASGKPTVKADRMFDAEGRVRGFRLNLGDETITLDPGKPWIKADTFKWVTRGLIEEPQSYHVLPNGTVDINGEKIAVDEPKAIQRLEHEFNKRHNSVVEARRLPASGFPALARAAATPPPNRVVFSVKLDHLGHLIVDCAAGSEHVETGLRGLHTLIQNGMMLRPTSLHVDPLQRSVEIDGHRFACNEAGGRAFQELLNAQYAPALKDAGSHMIEIAPNPASATGFDIRFTTLQAGMRIQVKGHLTQDRLDILQDPAHCDLLRQGVLLKLSPPNLLIRRRRPDGGEERVPELPDIAYRRVTAAQLQELLNHPSIRRTSGSASSPAGTSASERSRVWTEIRLTRNPQYPAGLWMECVEAHSDRVEGMAFTHHNLADLQQRGTFKPNLRVTLSLDHRVLSLLDSENAREEKVALDPNCSSANLAHGGQLLTLALKPELPRPSGPAPISSAPGVEPHPAPEASGGPVRTSTHGDLDAAAPPPPDLPRPTSLAASEPLPEAAGAAASAAPSTAEVTTEATGDQGHTPETQAEGALFEMDAARVNTGVFWRLAGALGLSVQEVWLSLPHVFENRRFEVLNFNRAAIADIAELRSEAFYGFYLTHVDQENVILVYACRGRHLEWGTHKCVLQASVTAEAEEYRESALRGLAQDSEGNFVFVVTPRYKTWLGNRARDYLPVCARFLTPAELLENPGDHSIIWTLGVAD